MTIQQHQVKLILRDFCNQALKHLDDPDCDLETVMVQADRTFALIAAEVGAAPELASGMN